MFRPDLLKKKRILITGGGTGLGKGMARRFLELGATVYICGRREEVLKQTAAELSANGTIHAVPCDVRNLEAVESMIDSIWTGGPLDVLVNNAAGNFIARTEELSPRAFDIRHRHRAHGHAARHHGMRTPLAQVHPFRHCPQHLRHLRARGVGLCRPLRRLQSWSGSSHPQPRGRVGQSRNPHERHRAWPNSHARRILPSSAAPRTRKARSRPQSAPSLRNGRGTRQPRSLSGERRIWLHQRRSHPHGRRRIPARRGRIQQSRTRPHGSRLAGDQAQEVRADLKELEELSISREGFLCVPSAVQFSVRLLTAVETASRSPSATC